VTLIRKHKVLELTGEGRKYTEADIYLWMVDHLREIRRQYGEEATARKFSHAIVDYLTEKKIPIPRELLDEEDETVTLSRTQLMRKLEEHNRSNEE
jgi:16S rRNA C1402 N4-methylase RsmH